MEVQKELLLSVRTSIENKGPYKIQIKKDQNTVANIKIRMKDDVTHIIKLVQGEYTLRVTKNEKDHLSAPFSLPNFESGSQVKLNITDTEITFDYEGLIKYRSVDDFIEILGDTKGKNKKGNTQVAKPKKERKPVSKGKNKPKSQAKSDEEAEKNDASVSVTITKEKEENRVPPKNDSRKVSEHKEKTVSAKSEISIEQQKINEDVSDKINTLTMTVNDLIAQLEELRRENISLKQQLELKADK